MASIDEQYAKAAAKARRLKKKKQLQDLKNHHRALLDGLQGLQADLLELLAVGHGGPLKSWTNGEGDLLISAEEIKNRLDEISAAGKK